ncbi:hypothetical protein PMI17_03637, partial [Pantoea sp. GM01]
SPAAGFTHSETAIRLAGGTPAEPVRCLTDEHYVIHGDLNFNLRRKIRINRGLFPRFDLRQALF